MQLSAISPATVGLVAWFVLHAGHDHAEESTNGDPLLAATGALGIVLFAGVGWYTYSRYQQ